MVYFTHVLHVLDVHSSDEKEFKKLYIDPKLANNIIEANHICRRHCNLANIMIVHDAYAIYTDEYRCSH